MNTHRIAALLSVLYLFHGKAVISARRQSEKHQFPNQSPPADCPHALNCAEGIPETQSVHGTTLLKTPTDTQDIQHKNSIPQGAIQAVLFFVIYPREMKKQVMKAYTNTHPETFMAVQKPKRQVDSEAWVWKEVAFKECPRILGVKYSRFQYLDVCVHHKMNG